jgi:hypothetical protein
MAVRLVPSSSVERLEEFRAEQGKLCSAISMSSGIILGVVVNVVTGANMTAAAWVLVLCSGAVVGFLGWLMRSSVLRMRLVQSAMSQEGHYNAPEEICSYSYRHPHKNGNANRN